MLVHKWFKVIFCFVNPILVHIYDFHKTKKTKHLHRGGIRTRDLMFLRCPSTSNPQNIYLKPWHEKNNVNVSRDEKNEIKTKFLKMISNKMFKF